MVRLVHRARQQMLRLRGAVLPPESSFDLQSPQHLEPLNRLLRLSGTPEVSIHFEVLGEAPQRTTLRCDLPQSPPHDSSVPNIYQVNSYTKIFVNVAFSYATQRPK